MSSHQQSTQLSLRLGGFTKHPAPASSTGQTQRSIHLAQSLRRHRKPALYILALCLLLSGVILYLHHGTYYEAKSSVYISPTFPTTLAEEKEQDRPYDAFVQDQVQTVTRFDILATAIQQSTPGTWLKPKETMQQSVARLTKQLEVERVGTTFQISIALKARSPEVAAQVVNAVTRAYIDKAHREEFYGRDERLATLRQERSRLQQQLDTALAAQAKLMQSLGIASIQQETANPYDAQLSKLHEDLTAAREHRMESEAQIAALKTKGGDSTALDATAQDAVAADAGLASFKAALNQRRAILIEQMNGLTPSNPVWKQDNSELSNLERELNNSSSDLAGKAASRIEQKLEADLYRTRAVELQLQQELLTQTHSATGAVPRFQQAKEWSKTIERLESGYSAVDERIRSLELESSSPGSIHLSSPALAPLTPVNSRTWMLALLLAAGSCLASMATAIAIDLLDARVYTGSDVESFLGFAPLGVLLDHDEFDSEVSGQYLSRLAGGLNHARNTTGAKTFLFTGLTPGGGSTTVVEKVARHLRNLNLRTLTIAATNVDGKVSYVTGGPAYQSSSTLKNSLSSPSKTTLPEDQKRTGETLALNIASESGASSLPVRSGVFVANVLGEIRNEYDIVLIDSSPILISADAEHISRVADGTVLVLSSGQSTRKQLLRAARLLERLEVAGVGVVLNRIGRHSMDSALAEDISDFEQQLRKQRGFAREQTASSSIHEDAPSESSLMDSFRARTVHDDSRVGIATAQA